MSLEFTTIARHLDTQAQKSPEACALRYQDKTSRSRDHYAELSFKALANNTRAMALCLLKRSIEPGMRILVMIPPSKSLVEVCFALLKIGAVPVLIDPGMGLKNFLACVRRTRPEAIIGIPKAILLSRFFLYCFKSIRYRLSTSRLESKIAREQNLLNIEHIEQLENKVQGNDLAAILFTSGSTGRPKGVCYTHAILNDQIKLLQSTYSIEAGEVDMPMLPVFALFNPALGVCTLIPPINSHKPVSFDPAILSETINTANVFSSFGAPALWQKLATYCTQQSIQLPSLKRILMAGAPCPPALIRSLQKIALNAEVYTPYGATEALPISNIRGKEILKKQNIGYGTCLGKPLPNTKVRIIESEDKVISELKNCTFLPANTIGEIIVSSPIVTQSYHKLPIATEKAKIPNSAKPDDTCWHRMGDMGYLDDEGYLWFCGRKAERVNSIQGPLYTDLYEAIFNTHPQVHRSALIGLGETGQETPIIVIEPSPEHWPKSKKERKDFIQSLKEIAKSSEHTAKIQHFLFYKQFPVDPRHNAKIHRLSLAKILRKKTKTPF